MNNINTKLMIFFVSLMLVNVIPALAELKTTHELPGGKSGQWYACFDEEGYFEGYRSIKNYFLDTSRLFLGHIHTKGKEKVVSTVWPAKGIKTSWNPKDLPKWITNTKLRYVSNELIKQEEYLCRRVEPYKNYLEME